MSLLRAPRWGLLTAILIARFWTMWTGSGLSSNGILMRVAAVALTVRKWRALSVEATRLLVGNTQNLSTQAHKSAIICEGGEADRWDEKANAPVEGTLGEWSHNSTWLLRNARFPDCRRFLVHYLASLRAQEQPSE
jgi:hypothetical protein